MVMFRALPKIVQHKTYLSDYELNVKQIFLNGRLLKQKKRR